ncbi:MAG TPA: prepilin-type N-terminal cleavage/methylation domain-containing protein [Candidatus Paceibacterota bacterium]|jgi:hypothetical protein|nr:prepilin-type N-terminal cleavage/methylation domain-containing protein [Candidatus Paceibacterota bacterium]
MQHSHFRRRNHFKNSAGMTLAELVVVSAIVAIVGVAVSRLGRDVFYYNRYFSNDISVGDQAQKLLRPMSQEIRAASPSATGAYAIASAQATDLTFYSDIDNDGLIEQVRYYLSGTSVLKEVTKPTGNPAVYNAANKVTTTVVTNVRNDVNQPIFNYYDSTYNGGAGGEVLPSSGNITAIRLVRITFVIDNDLNMPPPAQTVTTLVGIRNLKQQL